MPSNQTPNYQLSQWERSDKIQMEDFNADNAKIDAALSGKAEASAVERLSQTVASLSSSRNCQAMTTSYTGSGVSGANNPNSLSFARRPLFVHVGGAEDPGFSVAYGQTTSVCYTLGAVRYVRVTWSGNRVSWYEESLGYKDSPAHQMNAKDERYYVFALLSL